MEFIPRNPILKFNTDQLNSVRRRYNLDKPGDMSRAIDVLEAWIKTQKHFMKKDITRIYLEKAILASKGSLEQAKSKLDRICTFRTVMPDFFGENLINNRFDYFEAIAMGAMLPKPTKENYRACLVRVTGLEYTSSLILDIFRYIVLACEYIMAHDYNDGIVFITDFHEANISGIIKAINLLELRQIITIVNEGYSLRVKGIHVLTSSKAIDTLLTIVKQLISSKLGKRIFTHKDITSVYQYVPTDMFPIDYGGKEKSLVQLHDDLRNELTGKDFVSYVQEMNNARTDESCRQTDTFDEDYLGIPGSFRTMNVD